MKIVGKFGLVGLVGLGVVVGGCALPDSLAVADPAAAPPAGLPPRPADQVVAAEPAAEWANNSASAVVLPQADRKQQFTAELQLQTTDKAEAVVKKITDLAEKFSGYAVYSNMVSIRVKIPVKNSKDFLAEVGQLGEVLFREITSQDVTNEYRDLELKCKNLRALRDRLAELLKKAVQVEDILKIESELARITTELEQATGELNILKNSVDMVTVNIKFSTIRKIDPQVIPVAWIWKLGYIVFIDDVEKYDAAIKDKFAVEATLPEGFVTCFRDKDVIKAIDGNMSVLQVKTHDDLPGATPEFYQKLIIKHLKENNYKEVAAKKLALPDNRRGCLVSFNHNGYTSYAAVVFYRKAGWLGKQNKVLVIELYGKTANVEKVNMNDIIKGFKF